VAKPTTPVPTSKPAAQTQAPSELTPATATDAKASGADNPGGPHALFGVGDAASGPTVAELIAERDDLKIRVAELTRALEKAEEAAAISQDRIVALDGELADLRRTVQSAAASAAAEAIASPIAAQEIPTPAKWERPTPLTTEEEALAGALGIDRHDVFAVNLKTGTIVTVDGRRVANADAGKSGEAGE